MFRCPDCTNKQQVGNLRITALVRTTINVSEDESVEDTDHGDLEWENNNQAECLECGWSGTVGDMTIKDEEDETVPASITLTREQAIDELIQLRLEEHDLDDLEEWLRDGRIGFNEMSNAVLSELYADFTDVNAEDVTIIGQEPEPVVALTQADRDELVDALGEMHTMAAYGCPDEFDDEEHKRNVLGALVKAGRVYDRHRTIQGAATTNRDALTEFMARIAAMKTEEEYGEEGMSGDDAVMTLSELIATARTIQEGR